MNIFYRVLIILFAILVILGNAFFTPAPYSLIFAFPLGFVVGILISIVFRVTEDY